MKFQKTLLEEFLLELRNKYFVSNAEQVEDVSGWLFDKQVKSEIWIIMLELQEQIEDVADIIGKSRNPIKKVLLIILEVLF